MKKYKLPTGSTFTVVRQLCNYIPAHLVPKLARETGVDEQARTFTAWSHVVTLGYHRKAAIDYSTTWVEVRPIWGRGQAGTLAALKDIEASLPFELLGLDSDNGGEFLNHHVLHWLQKRPRPAFMTR